MEEIGTSLVAVVLVMASVFIPAAFLPGSTGQLYKQFAITIVISVAVSGFTALTLTPAMCALWLKHNPPPQRGFFAWFNRQVDRVTRAFGHAVVLVIKRATVVVTLASFALGLLGGAFFPVEVLPSWLEPSAVWGISKASGSSLTCMRTRTYWPGSSVISLLSMVARATTVPVEPSTELSMKVSVP